MVEKKRIKRQTESRPGEPPLQRAVTIFGAGVAGLTAAHELIERGFRVEVWEPKPDERVGARGCAVGGMARTQWSAVEWPSKFDDNVYVAGMPKDEGERLEWWKRIRAASINPIETEFYVTGDKVVQSMDLEESELGVRLPFELRKALAEDVLLPPQASSQTQACVYAECLFWPPPAPEQEDPAARAPRALEVTKGVLRSMGLTVEEDGPDRLKASKSGQACFIEIRYFDCPPDEAVPDGTELLVRFRRRERWLPGEHGYRFFPSFYSHVFDTMGRTPLLVTQAKSKLNYAQEQAEFRSVGRPGVVPDPYTYVESGRSVYDNLIAAEVHALAFADGNAPLAFPRYRIGSLAALLRQWRTAMERFDFAPRDLARYVLHIEEFAMMSSTRREQLGHVSWWEFVGGNEPGYYSAAFKQKIERWTEGLVAMSAEDCDARTYGAIMLQLLSDQYRSEKDYRDGILNGPTSDAWLDPWRRYLEAQGVRFIHGELVGFEVREDGNLWPQVNCFEPRYPGALEGSPKLLDGYFVLALPVGAAQGIVQKLTQSQLERLAGDPRDLKALAKLPLGDLEQPRPTGMLRHFAGIQFYFPEDLSWVHGHIYYPDAPWGLSSISQVRYWQQKRDWEHGYRGVMSAIIGAWDVRSPVTKKTAWESEPHELAEEVWRQLREGLTGPNDPRLGDVDSDEMLRIPDPIYWRLDEGLARKKDGEGYDNQTPLLISRAGTWEARPGTLPAVSPEEDGSEERSQRRAYAICGNVVLAGTYMKTFTRLTTMESANESARHAVNSILTNPATRRNRPSKLCKIFPLEHREPADFGLIKDIDQRFAKIERTLGVQTSTSLVSALGLDRWTAFLPKRRSP